MTTVLIIVVVLMLFGGGGYYGYRRLWYQRIVHKEIQGSNLSFNCYTIGSGLEPSP